MVRFTTKGIWSDSVSAPGVIIESCIILLLLSIMSVVELLLLRRKSEPRYQISPVPKSLFMLLHTVLLLYPSERWLAFRSSLI